MGGPDTGRANFRTVLLNSPKGETEDAFAVYDAVAAGGRFCGLKAALLSPSLNSYGSGNSFRWLCRPVSEFATRRPDLPGVHDTSDRLYRSLSNSIQPPK